MEPVLYVHSVKAMHSDPEFLFLPLTSHLPVLLLLWKTIFDGFSWCCKEFCFYLKESSCVWLPLFYTVRPGGRVGVKVRLPLLLMSTMLSGKGMILLERWDQRPAGFPPRDLWAFELGLPHLSLDGRSTHGNDLFCTLHPQCTLTWLVEPNLMPSDLGI